MNESRFNDAWDEFPPEADEAEFAPLQRREIEPLPVRREWIELDDHYPRCRQAKRLIERPNLAPL